MRKRKICVALQQTSRLPSSAVTFRHVWRCLCDLFPTYRTHADVLYHSLPYLHVFFPSLSLFVSFLTLLKCGYVCSSPYFALFLLFQWMVCAIFDRILITYLRNTHDDDSRDGGLALRQSCNSFFFCGCCFCHHSRTG